MKKNAAQILVADDDAVIRNLLKHYLNSAGFNPVITETGEELMDGVTEETHVVIADIRMPPPSGIECLRLVKERFPDVQVIILTNVNEVREAVEAMRMGAFDYLTKPFEPDDVVFSVRRAVQLSQTQRRQRDLEGAVSSPKVERKLISRSATAEAAFSLVPRLAQADATVLITGESGTGKGVMARAIHDASPRANEPFISVSCPSLPRELVESEMFGHEKGAFSGAVARRIGRAELADGGTLFLDEIGELPLELQPKILTFLQERNFYRVGGERPIEVNVRLIAATNRDLAQMVKEGGFREDLYYRLNVLFLDLPPLRNRVEDIIPLAEDFIAKTSATERITPPVLTEDAKAALLNHPWPGNVRELENLIARSVILAKKPGEVSATDLCLSGATEITAGLSKPGSKTNGHAPEDGRPVPAANEALNFTSMTLEELEKVALQRMLAHCSGNKAETARRLGITEKSVYNKMKRLGLS